MSTHPIDIIANVIRKVGGTGSMGAGQLAEHIVAAISSDERFVNDAVVALKEARFGAVMADDELRQAARVVLRSVGGS